MSNYILDRRAASCGGNDKSIVYKLYNYHCDGTENTAIDTGIKLFNSDFPNGFVIKLTATGSIYATNQAIIRCRHAAKINNVWPGIQVRWADNSGKLTVGFNDKAINKENIANTTFSTTILYSGGNTYIRLNNEVQTYNLGSISIDDTLCIGGEKDENNEWKSDRFSNITINSLEIIDLTLVEPEEYLYFEALEANSSVGMTITGAATPTLYYSTDKTSWTLWDYSDITLSNIGDRVYFYGTGALCPSPDSGDYSTFTGSGRLKIGGSFCSLITHDYFSLPYGAFKRLFYNNAAIVSISSSNFGNIEYVDRHACFNMFEGCSSLINIPSIHFISVSKYALAYMFKNCTSLTDVSNISVYYYTGEGACLQMFQGCTSLISANMTLIIPPDSNRNNLFKNMFNSCINLVIPPTIIGTTLGSYAIFEGMFSGCTSLVNAPELPSFPKINTNCFCDMFNGCTSLINAPTINTTQIWNYGCKGMFKGCTSLQNIKCLATDLSGTDCTKEWVQNVSLTGTFIKNSSMSSWPSGDNGIPSSWTVVDAS